MMEPGATYRVRSPLPAQRIEDGGNLGPTIRLGPDLILTVDHHDRADAGSGIPYGTLYVTDDFGFEWAVTDDGTLLDMKLPEECERCDGRGAHPKHDPEDVDCWACGGHGFTYTDHLGPLVRVTREVSA